MTDKPVSLDEALAVLNRIHAADPRVMPLLLGTRVMCNEALADDPTVQVGCVRRTVDVVPGVWEVGFLGILNGIFGVDETGWGYIAAKFSDAGDLIEFVRREQQ